LYWSIPRWLEHFPLPEKPPLLSSRGALTIACVPMTVEADASYPDHVRAWASDVWSAYAPQQELARAWWRSVAAFSTKKAMPRS
jgi:hypothetical protein